MASVFGAPRLQFFSSEGLPLDGGLLYTYTVGTTTKELTAKNTTDLTKKVYNTNPIVLGSDGYCDLSFSSSIKLNLKDKDGNNIWTVDNVESEDKEFLTELKDSNGATVIATSATGSASNYFTVFPSTAVKITASGASNTAPISIKPKGSGTVLVGNPSELQGKLILKQGDKAITMDPGASISSNTTVTLFDDAGTAGQVLGTAGSNTLDFVSLTGQVLLAEEWVEDNEYLQNYNLYSTLEGTEFLSMSYQPKSPDGILIVEVSFCVDYAEYALQQIFINGTVIKAGTTTNSLQGIYQITGPDALNISARMTMQYDHDGLQICLNGDSTTRFFEGMLRNYLRVREYAKP